MRKRPRVIEAHGVGPAGDFALNEFRHTSDLVEQALQRYSRDIRWKPVVVVGGGLPESYACEILDNTEEEKSILAGWDWDRS